MTGTDLSGRQRVWLFAFEQMRWLSVPVAPEVEQRYAAAMRYALAKALRRGLKRIPPELLPFVIDPQTLISKSSR